MDLVAVAVGGVVVAELELPRGDDRRQVGRRAGGPARIGLPAAGREGAQQRPVGRPVALPQPADHHGLRRRRRHLLRRPEVPRRVRRHVAVVDGQLDHRVVAVALGHVLDLDRRDVGAVVAGGQDDGARQELSRDVALGLERRAEVVEQGVPGRGPVGHRGDVRVRPVALGHVAVRLGEAPGAARASSIAAESAVRVRMWRRIRREVMSRTAIGVSAGGLSAAGACPAGPATISPPAPPFPCAKRRG